MCASIGELHNKLKCLGVAVGLLQTAYLERPLQVSSGFQMCSTLSDPAVDCSDMLTFSDCGRVVARERDNRWPAAMLYSCIAA